MAYASITVMIWQGSVPMQPATVYSRDRCVTGIQGMDEILRGGIPYGSTVLVSGTCGSGKTTLAMEFLVRGALSGEACAHFTATEPSVKLLENIRQFAFFNMNMIDDGLINVFDMDVLYSWLGLDKATFDLDDVHALIKAIVDIVNTIGVTRLVVDSVTTLCYKIKSEQLIRDFLFTLGKKLSTLGCTTLLISEITSASENAHWSSFGVEEAIADGIIVMGDVERMGHLLRFLQVVKMRGTSHSRAKHSIELTPLGVMLTPMLKWGAMSDKKSRWGS
jgi:circadian clock protein KaiC